ncbi:MAG TPA: S8 family serine peptidase [Blastocatellia bacterium]|nr:S8 family serine peptidase [Blastocatellia bacterium]HMY72617.1 S8 family serine peptidase [Blastocatellia bacterium]HMZ18005.1 S8 family serine peptidase [Blastocatellia bacterium]HNG29972.1 S8 family serine peptidase [Blastocatellia bacterium]
MPATPTLTGRGVRVAIIDSGVNPVHPHVGGVAGGMRITPGGTEEQYLDFIGHGTAVAGAIREKAPDAELYAVKVFDRALTTNIETILRALEWCAANQMHLVNLSLGTLNLNHREKFERVLAQAENLPVVAARDINGADSLPGCLPSVLGVSLDWDCPREAYRWDEAKQCFLASGYARPIPGVPPERNLNGISFAVAHLTGFAACLLEAHPGQNGATIRQLLRVPASR